MRNYITVGSKIGYLNPRTGKYNWAEVTGFQGDSLKMKQKMNGINRGRINEYLEEKDRIIKGLKTPSEDFRDRRMCIKFKGCNKLY